MAVRIRLTRVGRHKRPFYRIVVADSEFPRDGRFIEILGTYDPLVEKESLQVKDDRAAHWLKNGATMTDTVRVLFSQRKILAKAREASASAPRAEA